ncbi:MAG: DUF1501 domain-containing protein [Gemmataceae bacterium]
MLDLLRATSTTCQGVSRRSFLRVGALSGLGLTLPQLFASRQAVAASRAKDVNCILIWTLGGTSHHDTFDPKPDAPASVRGEFGTVPTAVPGVRFAEVAPRMARALSQFGLLRSLNPKNASHGMADYMMLSGHPFNASVVYPTYGSVVSHQKGFKTRMPPFVQLGSWVDRTFNGGTAGYLGIVHNPFEIIGDPNTPGFSARDISPPAGVDPTRLNRRRHMLGVVDALQREAEQQPAAFDSLDRHYQAAMNLITAPQTKRAFEVGLEHPRLRDRYGRTRFGQSLLLSRRLIEAGVRFITVTDPSWDTHANNFVSLKNSLMPPVDQAVPALLDDLADRGMLDSTLVVWLTDFGRTPKINSASGRDHWASASFALMAGAGIPGGSVIGKTGQGRACADRVGVFHRGRGGDDYTKLGILLDLVTYTPDDRPVRLNEGRPIKGWA